jgi:hypothetical protein
MAKAKKRQSSSLIPFPRNKRREKKQEARFQHRALPLEQELHTWKPSAQ